MILDSVLSKILQGKNLKRKSPESNHKNLNRCIPIQILSNNTTSVSISRNALSTPISPTQGIYLFGLEPATLINDQYLECASLDQPILKCKSDTTIRQIQKHIHRHLWPDLELDLDDVIFM